MYMQPPGMPTHGGAIGAPTGDSESPRSKTSRGPIPTLRSALPYSLEPSKATDNVLRKPQHAHRLDSPTGGLVLCCKTRPALQAMSIAFEERRVQKRYRAIVTGDLQGSGFIDAQVGGKDALTEYTVPTDSGMKVKSLLSKTITTVDLYPKTGRHHQLRRHLAGIGTPILGDKRYHSTMEESTLVKGEGIFLWALGLQFVHPITGEPIDISIDEPSKFKLWRDKEQRRYDTLSNTSSANAAAADSGSSSSSSDAVAVCLTDEMLLPTAVASSSSSSSASSSEARQPIAAAAGVAT
jgi:23S rRNA-/tRNA-specific pseudouridylate synthase